MSSETGKKPFKYKKLIIILSAVLGGLGIIAVIGMLTGWFGLIGPVDEIALSVKNTLTADSFTVSLDIHNEFWLYGELSHTDEAVTCQVALDNQNKDVQLYMEHSDIYGNKEILAVYEGYCITYRNGAYSYFDCSSQIATFFRTKQRIDGFIGELSGKKPDYEKAVNNAVGNKQTYDAIEEQVDFAAVAGCIKSVRKQANNRKWLKEQFDYTTKKEGSTKQYIFHVNDLDFMDDILPLTEEAFANKLTYNYVEDFIDGLDFAPDADMVIGVQDKMLQYIHLARTYTDHDVTCNDRIRLEFTDIGTTKIDTVKLKALLEAAKSELH